jgi:hypothetical protein
MDERILVDVVGRIEIAEERHTGRIVRPVDLAEDGLDLGVGVAAKSSSGPRRSS